MNKIGGFDFKVMNVLNLLASNPQFIETSKNSMTGTKDKMNNTGKFHFKGKQCIELTC